MLNDINKNFRFCGKAGFLLLFTLLAFYVSTVHAEPLQCLFQKNATVEQDVIRLGDIVHFNQESETTKALGAIIVCNSPMPGERILLRSVKVRNSMLRNHTIPGGTQWRGSGTVSVLRRGQRMSSEQILGYINHYLEENSQLLPAAKIRFLPKETPPPFALPLGEVSCEVVPSRPGILLSGRFALIFRIGGKTMKNISVRGKVEAITPVAVARKNLRRGEEVVPDDYVFNELDISSIPDAITQAEYLNGKKLRSALRSGQPLREKMLQEIPVILKGDPVKITIRSNSMLLTATGLALSDGTRNQTIRVQNSNSSKVLRAQVTGPGTVEIKI